jgi:hypothetical protein
MPNHGTSRSGVEPIYAKLHTAPRNCCQVRHPTSLDHFSPAGEYDSRVYHTKRLAFEPGLRQCATDIIRLSRAASGSHKDCYIPGLHDVCTVLKKRL